MKEGFRRWEGLEGKDQFWNRKEGKGGRDVPLGQFRFVWSWGRKQGELRDHVPLPLSEGRVDWQLTRNGDISRLERIHVNTFQYSIIL